VEGIQRYSQGESRLLIPAGGVRLADLMHKFSSRTLLIFVIGLLLAVILLGLATAYMSKLKQQRRLLSDSSGFNYGASAPLPESPAVRT
jgi:hypothetical protein